MRLSLVLESTVRCAEVAAEKVAQFAREAGYSLSQQEEISLAVKECAVNAVVHGNRQNADKKMLVTATSNPSKLVISVQDEGAGFDSRKVPDPRKPENMFVESGRGLLLIRSLMDEVRSRRVGSRGMKITMCKYLHKLQPRRK